MRFFKRRPRRRKSPLRDWFESIVIAIISALILRAFVVQAFKIPSGSMEKTLLVGDFLLVNKFLYGTKKGDVLIVNFLREGGLGKILGLPKGHSRFLDGRILSIRQPKRGDIIVFRYPFENRDFIKRCIGLPGDTVEVKDKMVYVNGAAIEEPYVAHTDRYVTPGLTLENENYQEAWQSGQFIHIGRLCRDNFGPVEVPQDSYFMKGDNRDNSEDSRFCGPLHNRFIKGKAVILYWSWKKRTPLWRFWHKIRWRRIGKLIK
ncbi:signal peptidase I [candidate division TA06 bacterium]|uniref:Signal peptidase I n=1 Tax=candidate division TA06 bacterium TaxID=2250710 RepID=A0A523XVG0_UNCT6|nr:MAG: signal peptidase I [candidate division TA06 bacterium]